MDEGDRGLNVCGVGEDDNAAVGRISVDVHAGGGEDDAAGCVAVGVWEFLSGMGWGRWTHDGALAGLCFVRVDLLKRFSRRWKIGWVVMPSALFWM